MVHNRDFFEKQKKHSEAKTRIVTKYFPTWARILGRKASSLTYLDLWSGPGYFEDGKPSTPIRILGAAANLKDESLRRKLRLMFYEKDKTYAEQLKQALSEHPSFRLLENEPVVIQKEVSREIIGELPISDSTFCFIDPFGY
ncbi:MAG: three-Cys-motif partner protein TcmP, partial [Candidatus Zixiibacteriota bacterium]